MNFVKASVLVMLLASCTSTEAVSLSDVDQLSMQSFAEAEKEGPTDEQVSSKEQLREEFTKQLEKRMKTFKDGDADPAEELLKKIENKHKKV